MCNTTNAPNVPYLAFGVLVVTDEMFEVRQVKYPMDVNHITCVRTIST